MAEDLMNFLNNNDRKSIPLEYFLNNGYEINISYMPRLDYLKVIDNIIGGKDSGK